MDISELPSVLAAWGFSRIRLGAELTDLGDRSRAWRVSADGDDYVAKLTFDGPRFTEPGMRIAAAVDRAGVVTGAPIPSLAGTLCQPIPRDTETWSLAVLEFVPGDPVDWAAPSAARECGQLLGRVHRILSGVPDLRPAGQLLDFYADEATRIGGERGESLADAVSAVLEFDRRVGLTYGVLYGDPSPEVLRDNRTGELALIDWGTPSWGPLLYDVVSWELSGANQQRAGQQAADQVAAGYRTRMVVPQAEWAARDLLVTLHREINAAWDPEPLL